MSILESTLDIVGLGGLVAGITAIFGYGRLNHKVETHAAELETLKEKAADDARSHLATAVSLARLDERMASIKEDVVQIREAVATRNPL